MYFDDVCVSDGQSNRGTVCGERVPTDEGTEVNASLWADSTYAMIAMQVQLFLLCIWFTTRPLIATPILASSY